MINTKPLKAHNNNNNNNNSNNTEEGPGFQIYGLWV